jgi:hypothetical protein
MARELLARKASAPTEEPVGFYGGVAGSTPVPVEIERGACYLAVAAITVGHARGLGLRATVGAREEHDEQMSEDGAAAVAFCAHDHDFARLDVEARGAAITWGLALFRLEGGAVQAEQPAAPTPPRARAQTARPRAEEGANR